MEVSQNQFKQLSVRDMKLVAKLSERIHYTNPHEPFLNHAFVILNEALPSMFLSVESFSINPIRFEQAINTGFSDEHFLIYRRYIYQHPLIKIFATAPREPCISSVLKETTSEKFHQTDLYQKFYRDFGVEDQLIFYLPHPEGVYVIAYSRDTAFSEKELTIMKLLRPQLQIALKNWRRIRELEQHMRTLMYKPGERAEVAQPFDDKKQLLNRLTPRQRDVAQLVAQGLKNGEVAEVLEISVKTVGKHLENIFDTLEIRNRSMLVAMWQHAGWPPK